MSDFGCRYRIVRADGMPVCQIASELTDLPLELCETNDSACGYCLSCGIAPQAPNRVTASICVTAAMQAGESSDGPIMRRMRSTLMDPVVHATLENTPCVFRGPRIGVVACKPCQAGSLTPMMVAIFGCEVYRTCTFKNTGVHPRIAACVTCASRRESRGSPEDNAGQSVGTAGQSVGAAGCSEVSEGELP
jgi:hypothetical protein